ncbi:hypothetical protein WH06_13090 [Aeromonas salmonicida subsp. salmonicida]|uniref:Uncharacterized protein n=1 Tax=Aeromonas salmonicida subsp. salmonicida 01-B526 TaxID=1076135 RepID=A0ABN0E049_AERSS|nr:hypothetical protein CE456_11615 [Aeromonas salmonicida]ASI31649.1 hypothetical protein CE462_10540 [Aeromonas salmonicida]EHI52417.1 hypothetical protein IYQ_11306 [Aeromonas salmonicida subsp. salmonicida 01-B526]OKA79475.1 hypothetical protein BHR42_15670 [Aeromonas salmonicida subsp. salmonicida]OSM52043.1 hypothetical protein WH06_13090 [Aeromonas salmonicida subsp. salmonicida]
MGNRRLSSQSITLRNTATQTDSFWRIAAIYMRQSGHIFGDGGILAQACLVVMGVGLPYYATGSERLFQGMLVFIIKR